MTRNPCCSRCRSLPDRHGPGRPPLRAAASSPAASCTCGARPIGASVGHRVARHRVSGHRVRLRQSGDLRPGADPGGLQRHQRHRGHAGARPRRPHGRRLRGDTATARVGKPVPDGVPGRVPPGTGRLAATTSPWSNSSACTPTSSSPAGTTAFRSGPTSPRQPGQVRHQDPGAHRVLRPRPDRQHGPSSASTTPTRTCTTSGEIFDVRPRPQQLIVDHAGPGRRRPSQGRWAHAGHGLRLRQRQSAPFTGPGLAMPNALISLGGGTNIFAGLKQSWTSVSWEQVVAADPQCIIINDYGDPDRRPEGEVPGDRPDHQEPDRGQEPLLPAAQLRRGHARAPATPKPSSPSPAGSTPRLRAARRQRVEGAGPLVGRPRASGRVLVHGLEGRLIARRRAAHHGPRHLPAWSVRPVALGIGMPMFKDLAAPLPLELDETHPFPDGDRHHRLPGVVVGRALICRQARAIPGTATVSRRSGAAASLRGESSQSSCRP